MDVLHLPLDSPRGKAIRQVKWRVSRSMEISDYYYCCSSALLDIDAATMYCLLMIGIDMICPRLCTYPVDRVGRLEP